MQAILPQELVRLAQVCPTPLYLVGGSVRDFLAGLTPAVRDFDICSPLPATQFAELAERNGITPLAVYKTTGTVKLRGEQAYEYACFRHDRYVRGTHAPVETYFTDDITLDAKRRDFTANAVYYDVAKGEFVDPLGGIAAIAEKRLTTVDAPEKVFGEDGLRLMRLARQAAQLGFSPDANCLAGARANAQLIEDIVPERIYAELLSILTADQKYGVHGAPYRGLTLLEAIGAFAYIFPPLQAGKGLAQRADFHKYDVLEHSLRSVRYAEGLTEDADLRLAALLHDVGKPSCMRRDGNAHAHPVEGEPLTVEILTKLKAPKRTIATVAWLVRWHMYDLDCKTSENKLRRFLVANRSKLDDLLLIKQADFSACADDTSKAPTCAKWERLLAKMTAEGVPFTLKELAVNGKELEEAGIPTARLSEVLRALLLHVAVLPQDNQRKRLIKLALGMQTNGQKSRTC